MSVLFVLVLADTEKKASRIKKSFPFTIHNTSQLETADLKLSVTLLYGKKPALVKIFISKVIKDVNYKISSIGQSFKSIISYFCSCIPDKIIVLLSLLMNTSS